MKTKNNLFLMVLTIFLCSVAKAENVNHLLGWQTFAELNDQVDDNSPDTNSTYDSTPTGSSMAASNHYLTGVIGKDASDRGYSGYEESTLDNLLNGEYFGTAELNSNTGEPKGALIVDYSLADGSEGARIGPKFQQGTSSWSFKNGACLGKNTNTCNPPRPLIGTDENGDDIYGRLDGNHLVGWQTFDRNTNANNNSGVTDSTPDTNSSHYGLTQSSPVQGHYLTARIGVGSTSLGYKGLGVGTVTTWLNNEIFGGSGMGETITDWELADGSPGSRIMPYDSANPGAVTAKEPVTWKFGKTNSSSSGLKGDFSITNNSNSFFRLDFIHFDARAQANLASPDVLQLYYVPSSGEMLLKRTCLEPGVLVNGNEELKLIEQTEWQNGLEVKNISADVSDSLDSTVYISPGKTADFRFIWSGESGNAQAFIDNLAFEGSFFSSQALGTSADPTEVYNSSVQETCQVEQQIGQQKGDVTITNLSDFYFRPDKIHFSALSQGSGAPKKLELIYLAAPGNLINVVEGSEVSDQNVLHTESWLPEDSIGLDDERNITVCMSCKGTINEYGARSYIAPGEKAAFRLQWKSADGKEPAYIDNLAFQGRFYDSSELQKVGYHIDLVSGEQISELAVENIPLLPFLFSLLLMGLLYSVRHFNRPKIIS